MKEQWCLPPKQDAEFVCAMEDVLDVYHRPYDRQYDERRPLDNRLFVDAVLWVAKTGAPWRDLPERFGNWNSAYRRFARWAQKGVWARVLEHLADPDVEWLILDSTIVRAHPHAAGAPKNCGDRTGRPDRRWAAAGAGSGPRSTGR